MFVDDPPEWHLAHGEVLRWKNHRPRVMGILNVTPDSFSDGGNFVEPNAALEHALALFHAGADIIDVGGESTRPNAQPVARESELARVMPVIKALAEAASDLSKETGRRLLISIDTTKAGVAEPALEAGAHIVNDVSAGRWDNQLWSVVAEHSAGYVLMHTSGRPHEMQSLTDYPGDVVHAVLEFLRQRYDAAIDAGIAEEAMACDPGIGFGKTVAQNAALLGRIARHMPTRPLLIGASRKSFVKKNCGDDEAALEAGTLAAHLLATANHPAPIWRVHDVPMAVAAAKVVETITGATRYAANQP